ncbi:putative toxin-antitoxin system toxin component, PIN family [Planktothrix mougeotii]|uniref:Toxin-antitoxin system toxin component, PIN family n=1 Tax=Planktothrix mougeotii LEGE 06226 TaxID=1828728 RepID=A0ABR9U807_9CYAN|nr:putative toxin-antitoxin system toxin component, PIN family [Planktothrix mougeotii]MBE9142580.1 putative toxin-antitoxin system toxin component, PIN family [Planktothrix mougeotii LEGE 06226]
MIPIVVFDTNILISAVLSPISKPFQCTALAKRGLVKSITCQDILDEFYEKLVVKFEYESERAEALVQEVLQYSTMIEISNQLKIIEADPDDDMVLECAVNGNATYIVTGDKHLLSLNDYQNIKIMKATDFLDLTIKFL